jgi:hypothetical protein
VFSMYPLYGKSTFFSSITNTHYEVQEPICGKKNKIVCNRQKQKCKNSEQREIP